MTAHIKYNKLDNINCATHKVIINKVVRNLIGFKGILFSDDLYESVERRILLQSKKSY